MTRQLTLFRWVSGFEKRDVRAILWLIAVLESAVATALAAYPLVMLIPFVIGTMLQLSLFLSWSHFQRQ